MRLSPIILCAALAAFASAAQAQPAASPPSSDDARCLLDMVALTNANEPQAQRAGQEGILFFVGRISAHQPSFDFMSLKALAQTMDARAAQSELEHRCGPLIQRYMGELEHALGSAAPPAAGSPPNAPH